MVSEPLRPTAAALAVAVGLAAAAPGLPGLRLTGRSVPASLLLAIRRTEAQHILQVTMGDRYGRTIYPPQTEQYAAPYSEESLPRVLRVGATSYGLSIRIGRHVWSHTPLPGPYLFEEATIPGPPAASIRGSLFYTLNLAAAASRYTPAGSSIHFWGRNAILHSYAGNVRVRGGFVESASVSFLASSAGHRVRQVLSSEWVRPTHIAPIVPPPRAVVAFNGSSAG